MKPGIEKPILTSASVYPEEYAAYYEELGRNIVSAEVSVTPIESPGDLAPLYRAADPARRPKFGAEEAFRRIREGSKLVVVTAPVDVAGALNRQVKARVAHDSEQDRHGRSNTA